MFVFGKAKISGFGVKNPYLNWGVVAETGRFHAVHATKSGGTV